MVSFTYFFFFVIVVDVLVLHIQLALFLWVFEIYCKKKKNRSKLIFEDSETKAFSKHFRLAWFFSVDVFSKVCSEMLPWYTIVLSKLAKLRLVWFRGVRFHSVSELTHLYLTSVIWWELVLYDFTMNITCLFFGCCLSYWFCLFYQFFIHQNVRTSPYSNSSGDFFLIEKFLKFCLTNS